MSRHYLLSCFLGVTVYFVSFIDANEAIVGGRNAEDHQFPYQVSVYLEDWSHECGGGIIGDRHILTAAHCVVQTNGQFYPLRVFIRAGTNNLHKTNEPAVTIEVERIFVPAEFNYFVFHNDGDIAVLELTVPLELAKYKRYLRKLKLPKNKEESNDGKMAKIAGFGWNWMRIENNTKHGNNSDAHLRFVEAQVLDHSECRHMLGDHVSDKDMCARVKQTDTHRRGVCNGDSGSPLVVDDAIAVGILSRSPINCEEITKPGVYTRVSHYLSFIRNALKGKVNRNIRTHEPANQSVFT